MSSQTIAGRSGRRRFVLFLRPFSVTRRLSVKNPYKNLQYLWPDSQGEQDTVDLEVLLADAVGEKSLLIGLGKPGEAIGAGRIETPDSDWQRELLTLVEAADAIIVIPSMSDGTRWEIKYLKEHARLTKCVFLMPPGASDLAIEWDGAIGKLPVWMPPYSNKGMLYTVNSEGQLQDSTDLKFRTTRALAQKFRSVSPKLVDELVTYNFSDQLPTRVVGSWVLYMLAAIVLPFVLAILFLCLASITDHRP